MIIMYALGLSIMSIGLIVSLAVIAEGIGYLVIQFADFIRGFLRGLSWGVRRYAKGRYEE